MPRSQIRTDAQKVIARVEGMIRGATGRAPGMGAPRGEASPVFNSGDTVQNPTSGDDIHPMFWGDDWGDPDARWNGDLSP